MKISLHPFITGCAFCLYGLISGNAYAQTFALEAGEKNIAAAYTTPAMKAFAPALIFDARLLYTRENNHQDLFAGAGLIAFTDITSQLELGIGLSIIAADPLASYLSALAPGAELVYRPSNMPRLKLFTNGYYATHALTFSQGRSVAMQSFNADYRLSAHSAFRIGYRRIRMVLNNGIITDFNRGVYLGLLWNF
ncbi:MAG: YfaZ family outer membrane protein [Gammaproteobacteria bacterium]|nr:YfaZ family outer membrane protein [Gammaproteobacteria bacterium]